MLSKQDGIVLSAYTGILMCDFGDLMQYAEKLMDEPILNHEFGNHGFMYRLKQAASDDFHKLFHDKDIDLTLKQAQDTYGYLNQVSVVAEECCELAKECNKYVRYPNHEVASTHLRENILEELADVKICLRHLEMMFDFTPDEIELNINLKVGRLQRWLDADDTTMFQTTVDRRLTDESENL